MSNTSEALYKYYFANLQYGSALLPSQPQQCLQCQLAWTQKNTVHFRRKLVGEK